MPAKKKPPVEIDLKFPETFRIAWEYWKNFKKEQFKFTYKPIGERAALEDLFEMATGDEEKAKQIIKQSIKNGWRGLFDLKDNNGTTANRGNNGQTKPGTSTARVDALKDWGVKQATTGNPKPTDL